MFECDKYLSYTIPTRFDDIGKGVGIGQVAKKKKNKTRGQEVGKQKGEDTYVMAIRTIMTRFYISPIIKIYSLDYKHTSKFDEGTLDILVIWGGGHKRLGKFITNYVYIHLISRHTWMVDWISKE